jgi:hypothetical protein
MKIISVQQPGVINIYTVIKCRIRYGIRVQIRISDVHVKIVCADKLKENSIVNNVVIQEHKVQG